MVTWKINLKLFVNLYINILSRCVFSVYVAFHNKVVKKKQKNKFVKLVDLQSNYNNMKVFIIFHEEKTGCVGISSQLK